jgi:hypothetical protein
MTLPDVVEPTEFEPAISVTSTGEDSLVISLRLKETATLGGITVENGVTKITINSAV